MAEGETKYVATGLFWRVVGISGALVGLVCAFYLEALSSARADREKLRTIVDAMALKVERIEGRVTSLEGGALRIDRLNDTVTEINLTLAEERGRRSVAASQASPPSPSRSR